LKSLISWPTNSDYTGQLMNFAQSARPFHCKDIKKAKLENRILKVL
jgi:hypothetical protein